jgi:hypothetical protein
VLDQLLSKKLGDVDKLFHLAEGILQDRHNFDFESIKISRAEARSTMLKEIGLNPNPTIPPRKKRKKKSPDEPSTYDVSIGMAEGGASIADIAKDRGLVRSTIEGHLAKGVEEGRLSVLKFMNEEAVEKITAALREMPEGFFSSELYSKLKGAYSYGQLRAVMAHTGIKSVRKKDLLSDAEPG